MGKGGCGLVEETANFARGLLALACCLLCAGPIMLIVGVIVLIAPNDRAANIKTYNDHVKVWENSANLGGYDAVVDTEVYAYGGYRTQLMQPVNEAISISGNSDGITSANSQYWSGSIPPNQTTIDRQFTYNFLASYKNSTKGGNLIKSSITAQVPYRKQVSTEYKCTKSKCYSRHSSNCRCSSSDMQDQCERNHGTWSTSGNSCREGNVCGTCYQTKYLTKACFVVEQEVGGIWGLSPVMSSCTYPFGVSDQEYNSNTMPSTPTSADVVVSLRSSLDPYLELEKLTKGKDDFGLTKKQQRNLGLALCGLGGVITLAMLTVGICICTRRQHRERVYQYKAMATGGQYEPVQQPMNYDAGYQQYPQQKQPSGYGAASV